MNLKRVLHLGTSRIWIKSLGDAQINRQVLLSCLAMRRGDTMEPIRVATRGFLLEDTCVTSASNNLDASRTMWLIGYQLWPCGVASMMINSALTFSMSGFVEALAGLKRPSA